MLNCLFQDVPLKVQWIQTHDSESQGQEEAGCTRRTSELSTGSTALKLVNTLNMPPLKVYPLVIKALARSNYIESVTQQWRKSAPPILNTSQCELNVGLKRLHILCNRVFFKLNDRVLTNICY